jgi:hypothetical protein
LPKKPPKHQPKHPKHLKPPKPPKPMKHPPHSVHEKDCSSAFLDEEICVEAKVKINPDVSIGDVKIECLESTIEPKSKRKGASEECTLYVNQLIRIKIPVHFSAKVEAKEHGVICHHDDSDESSSSSSSSD